MLLLGITRFCFKSNFYYCLLTFYVAEQKLIDGDIICHPITERNLISKSPVSFVLSGDTLFRVLKSSCLPRSQLQWGRKRPNVHSKPGTRCRRTFPASIGDHRDKAPSKHVYVSSQYGSQINFPRRKVSETKHTVLWKIDIFMQLSRQNRRQIINSDLIIFLFFLSVQIFARLPIPEPYPSSLFSSSNRLSRSRSRCRRKFIPTIKNSFSLGSFLHTAFYLCQRKTPLKYFRCFVQLFSNIILIKKKSLLPLSRNFIFSIVKVLNKVKI